MDLDSKKYAELQSIAKELGLKANMKADKLLKAIKQRYQQEENKAEQTQGRQNNEIGAQDETQEKRDATCREEVSSAAEFVNTRRGKGKCTKRKISDVAAVTQAGVKSSPPSAAKADTDPKVVASSVPSGDRGAKKRKVSSACDSDATEIKPPKETKAAENEQQPDNKDEAHANADTGKAPKVSKTGKIPRYQGLQQKKKMILKPVTPNFKKLHEAHFNKMESIDSYVQRKTKQMDAYKNSVKELKVLSDKTKLQQVDVKIETKGNLSRTSIFSPVPVNKRLAEEKQTNTLLSASKAPPKRSTGKEDAPFRPSVLSTRRINVRFSEATYDNEHKRSLVKTPARMSPCVASSTPHKQTTDALKPKNAKTTTLSVTKTPGPYLFTGNTSAATTPGTQKKASFDLKASLSRPLNYQPHKGKLKPFGDPKEQTKVGNGSIISNSHQKNYKQHQVQTREDRRVKQMEERKQKKEHMLGARRGLVMM